MNNANICNFFNSKENHLASVGSLFRNSGIPQWGENTLFDINNVPQKWLGIQGYCITVSSNIISAILARSNEEFTEIWAIATHSAYKNKGYATKLLTYFINLKATSYLLEVSTQNTAAINLYNKIGFNALSTRKKYYTMPDNSLQDAFVMKRSCFPQTVGT